MSYVLIETRDFSGDKAVDIVVDIPGFAEVVDQNGFTQEDARGNPVFVNGSRLYLDEVPGGPSWPPERIQLGVDMLNQLLPDDWQVRLVQEDPGRAHLSIVVEKIGG